jgi:hypothetical protein
MITEYLKFPKIFGSILLGFLAYQVSFTSKNRMNIFSFKSVASVIDSIYVQLIKQKINGKRFLAITVRIFMLV